MRFPTIECEDELAKLVNRVGFLPFFKSGVPGLSVEEHIDPEFWFPDEGEGVWEWKGPAIRLSGCAYGKYFHNKAVFISREWFPDFANYRRDGYDFDARYEDGLASYAEKRIYDTLTAAGSLLSKELKRESGFVGEGKKGFDTALTRLQMKGYITTEDFEYSVDSRGNFYGWGVARYTTPEALFGPEFRECLYDRTPEESRERILEHLGKLLPRAEEERLHRLLG